MKKLATQADKSTLGRSEKPDYLSTSMPKAIWIQTKMYYFYLSWAYAQNKQLRHFIIFPKRHPTRQRGGDFPYPPDAASHAPLPTGGGAVAAVPAKLRRFYPGTKLFPRRDLW
jgi:hypothetical protein